MLRKSNKSKICFISPTNLSQCQIVVEKKTIAVFYLYLVTLLLLCNRIREPADFVSMATGSWCTVTEHKLQTELIFFCRRRKAE